MTRLRSFDGRVVLLTGAAGGIGAALARQLARTGARLALADRDVARLEVLARSLSASTTRLTTHRVDLSDRSAIRPLIADVLRAHGGLHLLISNAGLTVHGPLSQQTPEEVDRVLDVDLRAAIHLTHAALPALRRADAAHVVLVSSMAGLLAFPLQSTYSAAKFGVRGFGQALRMELRADGVGVTTVLPGTTATGFLSSADSHDPAMSRRLGYLMRRYGTSPERVARATLAGVLTDRAEVRVGWDAWGVSLVTRLAPALLPALLAAGYRRLRAGRAPRAESLYNRPDLR